MSEEFTNENNQEDKEDGSVDNSVDNKVEELAEALAEVVNEEPVKGAEADEATTEAPDKVDATTVEPKVKELKSEETSAKESEEEKTNQEEPKIEEMNTEEPSTETSPTEETTTEQVQESLKSRKALKIGIISAIAVIALVAGIYFGMAKKYADCFLMGTFVNGTDCSGMTVDEVGNLLQKKVEGYVLTIEGANGSAEEIKGTDIGIVYNGYSQLKEAFKAQNSYKWPKALFEKNEIKAEIDFDYDSEKLNERIAALECLKPENQTAAVAATVVYKDGAFVIQDETYGTQIDTVKLNEVILAAVSSIETAVNMEETGCYIQPRFTKESPEVIAAKDEMNKYLTASITYNKDNVVVTLDKSQIYSWISVDENMAPVISVDSAKAFAKTLGNKYNTANRGGKLTTPTGKEVNVALAGYGRSVGVDAEANQLIAEIKEGKTVTREPIFSRSATPEGQTIWGTTYIEVDITEQHMWYIVNGSVAFETDVVTGKKGANDTPTGTYTILEKVKNKVLRGRPLANGKPSYLQPVDYWMRVTWSGIGFHDANWQPTFGGNRYVTNGSHGCINMPPAKAGELYNMISKGTPVVIHY